MLQSSSPFIKHLMATDPLPPPQHALYEYVFAGNGIFIRAQRQELTTCIPLLDTTIHGLPEVTPSLSLACPRIPETIMSDILAHSLTAWADPTGPKEALFHCGYDTNWSLSIPEQIRTYASVRCTDPFPPSYAKCLVEIHSHHEMPPLFSSTDDQDETGFRIFGVLGHFSREPQILFRIGIYGHFFRIPAESIAELPQGIRDGFLPLHEEETLSDNVESY
jgi:PRTRC genetic system protein A